MRRLLQGTWANARCRLNRNTRQVRAFAASTEAASQPPSWLELVRGHPGGVVIAAGFTATVAGAVSFLLDFPEPCRIVQARVQDRPEIIELIGSPFSRSWWWEGSVDEQSGRAEVQITLNGPKGSGTLYGHVVKWPLEAGGVPEWQVLMLEFHHVDEATGTLRTHSVDLQAGGTKAL